MRNLGADICELSNMVSLLRMLSVGGASFLTHILRYVLSEFVEVITAGGTVCEVHLNRND